MVESLKGQSSANMFQSLGLHQGSKQHHVGPSMVTTANRLIGGKDINIPGETITEPVYNINP